MIKTRDRGNENGEMMFKKLLSSTVVALQIVFFFLSSSAHAAEVLKKVENEKVCMVTDMHFGKKQIPVIQNGKTYYGCCENCKETLAKEVKARTAIDPVSGKSVDKATAYIVAREDNSVLYFENEKTFKQFSSKALSKPATDHSKHEDHAHH